MQTSSPQRNEHFRVLVIGAGACGLLIGQGLKQAEIECTIFERTDQKTYANRERDWSMGLHWGVSHLGTCLPPYVKERMKSTQTDPWIDLSTEHERKMPICNGRTGDVLVELNAISTRRVSRAKLRAALSENLDIRYGRTLVDIQTSTEAGEITAIFSNGEEAEGNVLVGCDSSNSFVRTWLLGLEKARCEEMPVISYNLSCRYSAEQSVWLRHEIHPLMKCAPHPDQNTWYIIPTLEIKDPNDPASWVFQHFMNLWTDQPVPATSAERLKHFKHLAERYCEPWRSAALWVPDDTFVPLDRIKHWPKSILWDNHGGRVTLAGDAAHPMCPYRAQGLNNALADAANYVNSIKNVAANLPSTSDVLKEAIDAYDKEIFERGSREIRVSAEQGYAAMHWEAYLQSPSIKLGQRCSSTLQERVQW